MKSVLLVSPYNIRRTEEGGAFLYQLTEKLSKVVNLDVLLFHYKGDNLDLPPNTDIKIIADYEVSKLDKLLWWFRNPHYFPLFTSRGSKRAERLIRSVSSNYDYILFDSSQTFSLADEITHPHKLYINHDIIFQRYNRKGSHFAKWVAKSEKKLMAGAETLFSFSYKDCKIVKELYGYDCLLTPVFIKKDILNKVPVRSSNYHVFFGDWRRDDNYECLDWFLDYVIKDVDNTCFKVIGGHMSDRLQDKIKRFLNIEYLGYIDDPYQMIADAKSMIVPLHTGAGIKVKCLEALACGTPIIGTEVAFEGIDERFNGNMILANTPEEYVESISNISRTLEEKNALKEDFINNYSQKSIIEYILR